MSLRLAQDDIPGLKVVYFVLIGTDRDNSRCRRYRHTGRYRLRGRYCHPRRYCHARREGYLWGARRWQGGLNGGYGLHLYAGEEIGRFETIGVGNHSGAVNGVPVEGDSVIGLSERV